MRHSLPPRSIFSSLLLSSAAFGAEPLPGEARHSVEATPPPAASTAPAPRSFSLTLSPLHLVLPVAELTAEFRVTDGFGVAALGGYGSVAAADTTVSIFELGVQAMYYFMHPFEGVHVGLEGLYVGGNASSEDVRAVASGLAIGPFVGWKLITEGGFTFVAQGGVQYVAVRADASGGGESASAEDARFIPLLNLNVGWSF